MFNGDQETGGAGLCAAGRQGGRTRRSHALLRRLEALDLDGLKTRPLEVVVCAREGDSNDEIARHLGISVSTVKRHLAGVVRGRPDVRLSPRPLAWTRTDPYAHALLTIA